jgi:hypothetical protein
MTNAGEKLQILAGQITEVRSTYCMNGENHEFGSIFGYCG